MWRWVHLRGIMPAGQNSFEEMSPFHWVIEIYDYFVVIIHRQRRKLKMVSHKMPYDFSYMKLIRKSTLGYEIEAMKEVNVNFAWLGGK